MLRSITSRIWITTIVVVLVVLTVSGLVHSRIISDTYLEQEKDELQSKTQYFVGMVNEGQSTERLAETADMLGVNVMVVGKEGELRQCAGMGLVQEAGPLDAHHPEVPQPVIPSDDGSYFYTGRNPLVGGEVLAMVYPLDDGDQLIVSTLFSPIEQVLSGMHRTSVYVGIGGLLLSGLLGLGLSRTISRPLREMTVAAGAMARGDFSRRVSGGLSTEVNILAESLNTLATALEGRIVEINRLDQTRRDFVANIAHEVRTPLAIIQASAEALEDGLPTTEDERVAYLKDIVAESGRLGDLTNDLLDLRRLESGVVSLSLDSVQIPEVVEQTLARLRLSITSKDIEVNVSYLDGLPPVRADRERLGQVFINLLANAIRYTPPEGQITITAETSGGMARIAVADHGPGIEEKDLPFVFERFYKADSSRTRGQGAGTGLGLAIVKTIIQNLGGKISVTSSPGHGACFVVELPVR